MSDPISSHTDSPLLSVNHLNIAFNHADNQVVHDVSFDLHSGKTLAVVGESGSGKSVTALSIMGLLTQNLAPQEKTEIIFNGQTLPHENDRQMQSIRGNEIAMIFQEPMTSLNPLHTIEKQLREVLQLHQPTLSKSAIKARIIELLKHVQLEALIPRLSAYPHELSGGQRQRIMIAMAIANHPKLLIADEPTTALDVTVQAEILRLLQDLQQQYDMAIMLITHDLTLVEHVSDHVLVMQSGQIVESGDTATVFASPSHAYTQHLLASAPVDLHTIADPLAEIALSTHELNVDFPRNKAFFKRNIHMNRVLDSVSIDLKKGHTLGIVGESGSGKSTLANAILRLIPSSGDIILGDTSLQGLSLKEMRPHRRIIQMVFQDPFSSLNPRMTIQDIIAEGAKLHLSLSKDDLLARTEDIIQKVGLDNSALSRYPHEFSGGQRQRISIARALILQPDIIIFDEPTSALDLSTQSEILTLLHDLQQEFSLSYIFISHDLRVIRAISHDIIVMQAGKIVEYQPTDTLFTAPQTLYTKNLIDAAFSLTSSSNSY